MRRKICGLVVLIVLLTASAPVGAAERAGFWSVWIEASGEVFESFWSIFEESGVSLDPWGRGEVPPNSGGGSSGNAPMPSEGTEVED